jgi:hypothetical protein
MLRKEYEPQYQYVLDCIDDEDVELTDNESKLKRFVQKFHDEYDSEWARLNFPNQTERVAQFLRGLPSICSIDYDNFSIGEVGKKWGYCKDDRSRANFVKNWWNCIADRIIQLCAHYNVEFIAECNDRGYKPKK